MLMDRSKLIHPPRSNAAAIGKVGEVGSGADVVGTLVGQDSGSSGEDVVDVAVAPVLGQDGEIPDDGVVVVVAGSHEAD